MDHIIWYEFFVYTDVHSIIPLILIILLALL